MSDVEKVAFETPMGWRTYHVRRSAGPATIPDEVKIGRNDRRDLGDVVEAEEWDAVEQHPLKYVLLRRTSAGWIEDKKTACNPK